ncbi:hypothetical protein WS105_0647 [Weissella ceti]|uniref:DEAD/DEAH box helicase n=1 Tax=Weissella ceti TaxID=759620 RepID=UPI0004F5CD5D|nr:DEAD/DEAH box helicase [Weissella ceti]AIM64237.1 hypothetical protein WS105_0647 [Weissella ceti]
MFKLRDYQKETIAGIRLSLAAGHTSIMVQSPPRSGKTVVMSDIARTATAKGNRVLFVVHRKEIVEQVIKTFKANDVDMSLVTVGMIQTFTRRIETLDKPDIIFVDEAHHALAKTYTRLLDAFPEAVKLLFTGTPYRMSGKGFEDVATDLVVGKSIKWLQEHGNIAEFDYYAPQDIDVSQLKVKTTGEYSAESITEALKPKIYGNAVKQYQELANGTQAIAYTHNVESSHTLAKEFNDQGIPAEAVDGKTPPDKRERIINAYRDGTIRIVVNAELFTEGLDLPNVDTVIMLRPTKSLSLYLQFSMRALNPREGKRAVLIDHVGNVSRFGLPNEDRDWTLATKDKKTRKAEDAKRVIENPIVTCDVCFGTFYKKEGSQCPYCGTEITVKTITYETDEAATLQKIEQTAAARRIKLARELANDELLQTVAEKSINELKTLRELQAYAKINGYKPGWAFHQAKMKGLVK